MTEEMDRWINDFIAFSNETLLEDLVKKVQVPFRAEPGYFYIHDHKRRLFLQCSEKSYFSDFPTWEVIPSQRARYRQKVRRRKRYERMMERGRK